MSLHLLPRLSQRPLEPFAPDPPNEAQVYTQMELQESRGPRRQPRNVWRGGTAVLNGLHIHIWHREIDVVVYLCPFWPRGPFAKNIWTVEGGWQSCPCLYIIRYTIHGIRRRVRSGLRSDVPCVPTRYLSPKQVHNVRHRCPYNRVSGLAKMPKLGRLDAHQGSAAWQPRTSHHA